MRRLVALALALAAVSSAPGAFGQPAETPRVTLHLDAPPGAVLLGIPSGAAAWGAVCVAPCDQSVDRTWTYFVRGGGQFRVDHAPPGATVRVAVPFHALARTAIVVGGVIVVVGIALSWAGITALLWQATQHQSIPWAAPVSIASIPVELGGSGLVVAGAVDLLTRRSADVTWSGPAPPAAVSRGPSFAVPLFRGEF
jgi:hypothetical protein